MTHDNDGRFPDGARVRTPYPLPHMTADTPREAWPWLAATIEQQGGPDEWQLLVRAREVAELEDGTRAPEGTPEDELLYPLCFRDSSEIDLEADPVSRPQHGRANGDGSLFPYRNNWAACMWVTTPDGPKPPELAEESSARPRRPEADPAAPPRETWAPAAGSDAPKTKPETTI